MKEKVYIEILSELWKIKDLVANENEYSIDKLAEKLRKKEKEALVQIVDLTSQSKFAHDKP